MQRSMFTALLIVLFCFGGREEAAFAQAPVDLEPPSAFASIDDLETRSAALFSEAGKVLQSPRCLNCHPVERLPTQGEDLHAHVPFMPAGAEDHGVHGLPCATCHAEQNVATLGERIKSIPGTSHWGLAPASMAWRGLSLGEICAQLRDPARNGGRSLEQIHSHVTTDPLVTWGWQPGEGRAPAPGTQAQFGALIAAWVETGAHCPSDQLD
jgi:hypothetical protein